MAQSLKPLPPMQDTWVRSLGWEDPLEKEMVTHFSILAWRIPWMEKPGRLTVHGVAKSRTWLNDFTFTFSPGNFLPPSDRETSHLYSGVCLKLPMVSTNDRGPKTEPSDGNELGNDTWLSAFVTMSHEEKKYIISLKVVENKHLQNICPFIIFKENSSLKLE